MKTYFKTLGFVLVVCLALSSLSYGAYQIYLQYAEDAAHTSGDTGTAALGVRKDTAASLAGTDGDYTMPIFDSTNRLWANTELPDAAGEPSAGAAPTAPSLWAYMVCKDYGGSTFSACMTSPNIAHDAAASSANPLLIGGYASAAAPTDVSADNDSVRAWFLRNGAQVSQLSFAGVLASTGAGNTGTGVQRVIEATDSQLSAGVGATGDAAATAGSTGSLNAKLRLLTSLLGVEDTAETAGTGLAMAGSVRRDTMASSAGTTGDNATVNTDANGLMWTRNADPCSALAKTHIPINVSTATTTELTPSLAGASTNYYVCGIDLVTAAANNVALADDDTDGCGSVTSGLAGGTTAASGWNFAANGGLTKGNGTGTVFVTGGTNRVLCLVTSAATQLSGSIQVVAAP